MEIRSPRQRNWEIRSWVLGRAQKRGSTKGPTEDLPNFGASSRPSDQCPHFISRDLMDFLKSKIQLPTRQEAGQLLTVQLSSSEVGGQLGRADEARLVLMWERDLKPL